MPKRKRDPGEPPSRKSARLEEKLRHAVLPSPSSSHSARDNHCQTLPRGRSIEPSTKSTTTHKQEHKEGPTQAGKQTWSKEVAEPLQEQREHRGKILPAVEENKGSKTFDPISHWAIHNTWPSNFATRDTAMSLGTSSKRRSESTHRSDRLERMEEHGVFMKSSALIQKSSRELCSSLLTGNRTPQHFPCFLIEKVPDVLERVDGLNEGRIQRDITPWVVPSAEKLFLCGELDLDYIGDDVQAEWTRCAPMGSTRPKPDSANGLLRKAFTKEELEKLRNYASPMRPFFFTPDLCFPFLICEAKSGEEGLNKANRQNIHSASIAVRAIIELHWHAFGKASARVKELYGKILVFTVSHNSSQANLYGHFAVPTESTEPSAGGLEFYRYDIAMYSLSMFDGADRYKPYNFIHNLFDQFAPEHLQRIKDAAAALPAPAQTTGLSFSASELELEGNAQADSQDASSRDDAGFRKPALPATAMYQREIGRLKEQMEDQKKLMEDQKKLVEQLMEREKRMAQQMEELLKNTSK